jgi:methionyl-tRNA formyltransferase
MNLLIVTQEEPFFIPKILARIDDNLNREDKIVGITILKPYHKSKNYLTWIRERVIVYTYRELMLLMALFTYVKIYEALTRIFPLKKFFSVRRFCSARGIRLFQTADINSAEYHSELRSLDIDMIISHSATQIFKKSLIEIPRVGCVNVHGTLLPRHRGVMGSWWALASGDKFTGVTVHQLIERLDAGDILLQEKMPIEDEDTQFSIAVKTKKMSADLTLRMLDILREGEPKAISMDINAGNINTFPTKEQAVQFRKSKKRIIKINDLANVISDW